MADVVYVVNNGLGIVSNRIKGSGTEPKHVGWGTGTTAATVTDPGLETAAAESRTAGTTTIETTTKTDDTYRVVAKITCTGSQKDISEVGIFDAATVGTLFVRATFTAITVPVGDSIEFTINVKGNQA